MDCLFCSIIKGDIPSKKAYEDEICYAFYDIAPQAAVHILVIPKLHIASACNAGDVDLISGLGRSPGEGNGKPFQYSCLGNPIDRGAW